MTATLTHRRSNGRLVSTRQRGPELNREFDQDEVEQDRLDADPGDDEDDLDDEEDEQQDADKDQEPGEVWDADEREDEPDEDAEEQPEPDDDQEDEPDGYGSLDELAAAIDDAHRRSRRCHELSNKYALHAGQCLVVVKQRLGHGKFGRWVAQNVEVSHRQADRYMELYEGREGTG